jgi:hypothetical protein
VPSTLQDPGSALWINILTHDEAAAADMRRRFKFLGDTGVWRLLTSASRDSL